MSLSQRWSSKGAEDRVFFSPLLCFASHILCALPAGATHGANLNLKRVAPAGEPGRKEGGLCHARLDLAVREERAAVGGRIVALRADAVEQAERRVGGVDGPVRVAWVGGVGGRACWRAGRGGREVRRGM